MKKFWKESRVLTVILSLVLVCSIVGVAYAAEFCDDCGELECIVYFAQFEASDYISQAGQAKEAAEVYKQSVQECWALHGGTGANPLDARDFFANMVFGDIDVAAGDTDITLGDAFNSSAGTWVVIARNECTIFDRHPEAQDMLTGTGAGGSSAEATYEFAGTTWAAARDKFKAGEAHYKDATWYLNAQDYPGTPCTCPWAGPRI